MGKLPREESALEAISEGITSLAGRLGEQVVWLNTRRGYPSSGTLWESGFVVTADHVVGREEGISVTFADGEEKPAELAGTDPASDLALLTVETGGREGAEPVEARQLRPGQLALALSRNSEKGLNASLAVVNAIGGEWQTDGGSTIDNFIRLDVRMYAGFSGGPLFDARGRLIGVNSSRLSRQSAISIPVSTVARVVKQLKEHGHVRRGYLGIASLPVGIPEGLRGRLAGSPEGGLMIMQIDPGSAAESGGLLPGDIIIALDGRPTRDPEELQAALGAESIGGRIAAKLVRGGSEIELSLTVGERPRPQRGAGRFWRGHHRQAGRGE